MRSKAEKRERSVVLTLVLVVALIIVGAGTWAGLSGSVYAGTTQDVTVNATPEYMTISNSPSTFNFGVVATSSSDNTGNAYFTITNGSTVNIDISIGCDNWSGATAWVYGSPASDTGRLMTSSADGGTSGSSGQGAYDILVADASSSKTLLCDNVTTATNPTWEMELEAPSAFTHGDENSTTVTVEATAE